MVKPIRCIALSTAALLSLGAHSTQAQSANGASVSYTYGGLEYVEQNLDDYDCNQDGLSAYGSYAIDGPWFAVGSLTDVSGDKSCGSTTIQLGAGYHTLLTPGWDLYGTLSAERTDPDHGDSDTGLVAAIGARGWMFQQLEGKAEIAHHTVFDDTTELNLGANYWFTKAIAGTLDTSFSDEGESIALGARMNF
ncbi:outer membrane beta-barrel protein [Gilvimarinus sp. DA14]|uniref:outer membrane beta-barrel protein n=1 Tax=Gilvimarinus sp. DA14 TaxID=2956798 RepID=UPI0020B6504B|nr:outer membrane beta-barrel protein [Gilvimarinus sp. DA14]UTF60844.1 porin family protein [Gilvimarinus sp. DA14]